MTNQRNDFTFDRRRFIGALGAGAATTLAGCAAPWTSEPAKGRRV